MAGKFDCYGLTDRGQVRENNEDQFLIADLYKSVELDQTSLHLEAHTRIFGRSQGKLLLVADGMGGHAAGERASTLAVDSIVAFVVNTMRWFYQLDDDCQDDFPDDLKEALVHGQRCLVEEAAVMPERRGMGTTLTMAYIIWPRMFVVHVGDSRCYLLRGTHLEQITHDHTLAQQLVDSGTISEADAKRSRYSHVLWNVLGSDSSDVRPDVYRCEVQMGDAVLLCTDGLTRHVTDDELVRHLGSAGAAQQVCERLVQAANAAGGSDNITAVVARFREAQEANQSLAGASVDLLDDRRQADTAMADTLPPVHEAKLSLKN